MLKSDRQKLARESYPLGAVPASWIRERSLPPMCSYHGFASTLPADSQDNCMAKQMRLGIMISDLYYLVSII